MCFETPYIGLLGSCENRSNSGLFINDLPGISLRGLVSIANEEDIKGETLFRVKEKNAIRTVKRDFLNLVQKKYSFDDILGEYSNFGNYKDSVQAGCVEIELINCKTQNVVIDLSYFSFFSDFRFNTELVIEEEGIEISRTKLEVIKGENILRNKVFSSSGNIRIKFNVGEHNIKKVENCSCVCSESCNDCIEIKYYSNSELIDYIPVNIKVLCRNNYDNLICVYERDLAEAVLFQTGIQIMEELLVTNEINPIVVNSKDDAEKLLIMWNGSDTSQFATISGADKIYRQDGEYYKSLLSVVLKAKNYIEKSSLNVKAHEPYLIASI